MQFDTYTILLALLAGGCVLAFYLGSVHFARRTKESSQLAERISTDYDYNADTYQANKDEKSAKAEMLDGVLMMILPLLGKSLEKEQIRLQKEMTKGGITSPDAPTYYLFAKYILSIVLVLIGITFFSSDAEGLKRTQDWLVGGMLVLLGLFGPVLYLKNAIAKRKKILIRSFPDALDLLLVCVESGLALDAAIARVCSELGTAHPVITAELDRTRIELSVMSDRTKALYGLGERTDIVAFRALAASLIQSEKFGTSLSDTLRVMSDDFRQTRLLEAENKANRLPALMTIPLICFLLPAFIIIIMAPAIIRVMQEGLLDNN